MNTNVTTEPFPWESWSVRLCQQNLGEVSDSKGQAVIVSGYRTAKRLVTDALDELGAGHGDRRPLAILVEPPCPISNFHYAVSDAAIEQAAALGIGPDTRTALLNMAQHSVILTGPGANRRFEQYAFLVEDRVVVKVRLLDPETDGRRRRRRGRHHRSREER